jgi:hypothetical protein
MMKRSTFFVQALLLFAGLFLFAGMAYAQTANTATIEFQRPTVYPNGDPVPAALTISYNVYQGVGAGTTKAKVGTITATTGSITTGLASGNTYCFQVTAFVTGQEATTESARSNEACKSFTGLGVVTITVR